ncbi:alpha/beta fold hydrolase [Kribbella speibonae]|uniref:Alpha/beta fold hydrolase n=1 Tax=Kribbella speibonae TaxID=1572660 RepID=A0A4R0J468_9ACTN|nr:alpha/beta fold hydrolase [Kribbella speibonae]TCC41363.1 alpha/beta fold hydrolase [Kribbella speibonae]
MTYRYAELSASRIAYRVHGSGPAIVLMKNNRRPPDYPIVEQLSEHFRVLQIHPIGFGASDRPEDFDFGDIGRQVLAVLDQEGVDRFAVWGFSQPACMSAVVAASTDRAAALVMGGVTPIGFPTDGEMRRMERDPRMRRPPLEFWRSYRSYDWHHELRRYPGTKVAYLGTADPAIRRLRRLRPVLEGIGFTYLEFDGLNHSTCGLGDASADGRRVAQKIAELLLDRGPND